MMHMSLIKIACLGLVGLGVAGCATNAGTGALVGGATGAGIGAAATGHPGGALLGGAIGAITGGLIGDDMDRREAYRDRYYYDDGPRYHAYHGGPVYETRTTYRNPDGGTTTYIDRNYGY